MDGGAETGTSYTFRLENVGVACSAGYFLRKQRQDSVLIDHICGSLTFGDIVRDAMQRGKHSDGRNESCEADDSLDEALSRLRFALLL